MRKIIAICLAAFTMSSAFAGAVTKTITPEMVKFNKHLEMNWSLNDPNSSVIINNKTESVLTVYVARNQYRVNAMSMSTSDKVSISGCNGGDDTVHSFIACQIKPGLYANIFIKNDDFKNGADGVYSTN